jgi:hypothetical protein
MATADGQNWMVEGLAQFSFSLRSQELAQPGRRTLAAGRLAGHEQR